MGAKGGEITRGDESFSSRLSIPYGNLYGSLALAMTKLDSTMNITDLDGLDLDIGDFILVDSEIMRVKQTVTGNPVQVYRGLLGTQADAHISGSAFRRIDAKPVELRRHSIIRASGHTFEYLGYGPGNYSTAFPDRHDRQLSASEEVLSQSFQEEGGFVVYTGMNSDGDFYISNKRVITTAGDEEVFSTPRPRFRGESKQIPDTKLGFNVIKASEVNVSDAVRVDGGDSKTTISQFDGPLLVNNKLTVTSNKGLESPSLFLQGNETVSRKYTVGVTQPASSVELVGEGAGNPGDIIFNGNPFRGQNAGWCYTTDNDWYPWGAISNKTDRFEIGGYFIGTFTGDGAGLYDVSDIWQIDATGIHTTRNVGFGSTNSSKPDIAMYVQGNAEIRGTMKVFEIIENTTLDNATVIGIGTTVIEVDLDRSSIYYFTQDAGANWAVNMRARAGLALTEFLEVSESITLAITTKQGPTPYYNDEVYIDDIRMSPRYYGSLAINTGNANSLDLYTYVLVRKSNTGDPVVDFDVLYSQSQYQ